MSERLSNAEIRKHKATAQRMKPILHIGKAGLSEQFLQSVEEAFQHHELIKIKFSDHKDEKHELAPVLAEKTRSHLITLLGNVVVLFRPKPKQDEEAAAEEVSQ